MDINVKRNVDVRITDHKEIVRRELAKYRQTNMQQIDYHFKHPQMVQVPMHHQPMGYYPYPPQGVPIPHGGPGSYEGEHPAPGGYTTETGSEYRDQVHQIEPSEIGTTKQKYSHNFMPMEQPTLTKYQTVNYDNQSQLEHEMMIGQY